LPLPAQGSVQNKYFLILSFTLCAFLLAPKAYADNEPTIESGEIVLETNSSDLLFESEETKNVSFTNYEANNVAVITNNIIANSSTGNNKVLDSSADALIQTGDSSVSVEVINYVNSSFLNDNSDSTSASQANVVALVNNVSAASNSGDNTVGGGELSVTRITTGNSKSSVILNSKINVSTFSKICDPETSREIEEKPQNPTIISTPIVSKDSKVGSYTEKVEAGLGGFGEVLPFTGGSFTRILEESSSEVPAVYYLLAFVIGYWLTELICRKFSNKLL
jgi:hypothetical protein